jgi:type IV secretory pathway VirB4 component
MVVNYDTRAYKDTGPSANIFEYPKMRLKRIGASSYKLSTRVLSSTMPQAVSSIGRHGVYIGQDIHTGNRFAFSPFELYRLTGEDRLTNPNVTIMGAVGRGKSGLIKSYLLRELPFGRRVVIFDVKGEYGSFADACGVKPIRVTVGGSVRINPLEAPSHVSSSETQTVYSIRLKILNSLIVTRMGHDVPPDGATALALALEESCRRAAGGNPLITDVLEIMYEPTEAMLREVRVESASHWKDLHYEVTTALHDLCRGEYAGLFNGHTTEGLNLDADVVVFDLDGLQSAGKLALGLFMTVALARLQNSLVNRRGVNTIVVYEEGWHVINNPGTAKFMQESWLLSRRFGMSNWLVIHQPSQLTSVAADSAGLGRQLLVSSGTKIVYPQEEDERITTGKLLNLTDAETDDLIPLLNGQGLWKIGRRSTSVAHHIRSQFEWDIVSATDKEMNVS